MLVGDTTSGPGVGAAVGVGDGVGVAVGVGDGVAVGVGVGEGDAVGVGDGDAVGTGVGLGTTVGITVGLGVALCAAVGVGTAVVAGDGEAATGATIGATGCDDVPLHAELASAQSAEAAKIVRLGNDKVGLPMGVRFMARKWSPSHAR